MLPAAVDSGTSAFVWSSDQTIFVGIGYVTLGAGAFPFPVLLVPPARACSGAFFLKMRSRKKYAPAPKPSRITRTIPTRGNTFILRSTGGGGSDVLVADVGRGFATWAADKINFGSPAVGAWGITILRKQVGQLNCPPLALESAVMC